jgi:hypothetical protein
MKRTIQLVVGILILLIIAIPSYSEMKTFVREYTYQASESDSKQSCRVLAMEQVKRLVLEELGTYLESYTEVKNYELTKDQVTMLSAGVVKTQIEKEKWDGRDYWLQARCDADPDEVAQSIDKVRKDRQKMKEMEESKKKRDDTMKDINELQNDLSKDKGNPEKMKQYDEKVASLKALQSMSDTFKSFTEGKPEKGMGAFFNMMGDMIKNSPSQ